MRSAGSSRPTPRHPRGAALERVDVLVVGRAPRRLRARGAAGPRRTARARARPHALPLRSALDARAAAGRDERAGEDGRAAADPRAEPQPRALGARWRSKASSAASGCAPGRRRDRLRRLRAARPAGRAARGGGPRAGRGGARALHRGGAAVARRPRVGASLPRRARAPSTRSRASSSSAPTGGARRSPRWSAPGGPTASRATAAVSCSATSTIRSRAPSRPRPTSQWREGDSFAFAFPTTPAGRLLVLLMGHRDEAGEARARPRGLLAAQAGASTRAWRDA